MKFGSRIIREAFPEWKGHYLRYNELKKLISLAAFAKLQNENKCADAEKVNHKLRGEIFKERWKEMKALINHLESRRGNIAVSSESSDEESRAGGSGGGGRKAESRQRKLEEMSRSFPKQASSRLLCRYFFFILNRELRTIIKFATVEAERVKERINLYVETKSGETVASLESDGGKDGEVGKSEMERVDRPVAIESNMDTEKMQAVITVEIARLAAFIELNYTGFYKIVKKFDKKVNKHSLHSFMKQLDDSQLMLNSISSIEALWKDAKIKYKTYTDADVARLGVLSPRTRATKGILDAVKVSKMALETVNPGMAGTDSSRHTDQIVLNLGPMLAPMINDASFAESNIRILETKIEMFGSLMSLFAENIGTVDPDVSLSVEQLCNAYCLLFGVKGRRDRASLKRYQDSSEEDEPEKSVETANFVLRETLEEKEDTTSKQFHERLDAARDEDGSHKSWRVGVENCLAATRHKTIVGWLPRYNIKQMLVKDTTAAISISIVGVAQGIAYSSLVGVSPELGCYSVIFPALIYSLFGGSKNIAIGPMSIPCLLLGSIVDEFHNLHPTYTRVHIVLACTILCGALLILLSLLRVGSMTSTLVSRPVLKGFVSASAFLVILGQLKHVFGISYNKSSAIQTLLPNIFESISSLEVFTFVCALFTIVFAAALKQVHRAAKSGFKPLWVKPREDHLRKEIEGYQSDEEKAKGADLPSENDLDKNEIRRKRVSKCVSQFHPVVVLLVIGMLFGGSLCDFEAFRTSASETVGKDIIAAASGVGASLPAWAYQLAATTFECHGDKAQRVKYLPTGSGNGIKSILENTVDFAGTDVEIKNSTYATYNTNAEAVLLVPSLASAVCATANVPGVPLGESAHLVLKKATLAKIFKGDIQYWDHEDILAQNPNFMLLLPHKKIQPVVRQDSSGTTAIFTSALASFVSNFTPGVGKVAAWPSSSIKGLYNAGVIDVVYSTPYSIGYAVVGDVKRHKDLQCIAFENGAKVPITPSREAVHAAIAAARGSARPLDLISSASVNSSTGAWPISSYTYIAMRKFSRPNSRRTCTERRAVVDFLMWLYTSPLALEASEKHNFVVLSYEHRINILKQVINLTCGEKNGEPMYGSIIDYSNFTKNELLAKQSRFCAATSAETGKYKCGAVAVIGPIAPIVNAPNAPPVPFSVYATLAMNCLLLSSLMLIEHLANAKICAQKIKVSVDENHELFALGLSNIFGGLFSCFVTGGGFSRTAINVSAGAVSQMSLLLSALFALVITFTVAPAIAFLPKFVIAVVIIGAVSGLVDVKEIKMLWKISKSDFFLLVLGAIFTMTLGITNGLLASVALSIAIFLKAASVPVISTLGRAPNSTDYRPLKSGKSNSRIKRPDGILILRFEAPLFFANFSELEKTVNEHLANSTGDDGLLLWESLVLDFSCIPWIDATAAIGISQLFEQINGLGGVQVYVAKCTSNVYTTLKHAGFVDMIGKSNFFFDVHSSVTHVLRVRRQQESAILSRFVKSPV
jgi:phosphate ABC transporter phosphate-binding protein